MFGVEMGVTVSQPRRNIFYELEKGENKALRGKSILQGSSFPKGMCALKQCLEQSKHISTQNTPGVLQVHDGLAHTHTHIQFQGLWPKSSKVFRLLASIEISGWVWHSWASSSSTSCQWLLQACNGLPLLITQPFG